MTEPASTPAARSSRTLQYVLGGCVVLALCLCLVGGAGAGYWYFRGGRQAQAGEPTVEYILDASPRMALEGEGGTRLTVAQGVLAEIVRPADAAVTAGLRVFGSGKLPAACQDTDLLVPLAPANQTKIADRLTGLQAGASADAALGEAMVAAIRDLARTRGPHSLVVVTGGADSCNPEAGQLLAREADKAGIKLELFVVGYQVADDEAVAIKSLVDELAGGTFVTAKDEDELRKVLASIQAHVDNPNTTTVADVIATVRAAAPQGTAIAGPTAASTAEPTLESGATAVATSESISPGSTAEATAVGPGPGSYAAQTACDNPYFPLRAGATWTYSGSSGNFTWVVTDVSGDLSNASATMTFSVQDVSITYHWTCTSAGLVSYDFGNIAIGGATGAISDFRVGSHSGVWLPPASQLEAGASWDNSYTLQYSVSAAGTSMDFSMDVAEQSSTTGTKESVSVPAGAFDALRIDSTSQIHMAAASVPATDSSSTSTYHMGYGVGIVRFESNSSGTSSVGELVSYNIP